MPSAVSVPAPAFTLSFGGVDFRLDPTSSPGEAAQVSFQSNDDGVFVNLKSFTGTLRVSTTPSSLPAAVSTTKSISKMTAKVEEEPASPANAKKKTALGRPGVSPTQQQLPFGKAKPAAGKTKKAAPTKVTRCGIFQYFLSITLLLMCSLLLVCILW